MHIRSSWDNLDLILQASMQSLLWENTTSLAVLQPAFGRMFGEIGIF